MTLGTLALRSLFNRRATVLLTVFTMAVSIALLLLVEQLRLQLREGFYRTVSGTDLIVGAPTSPVQLLLFSVFGIGNPSRNVSWTSYQTISAYPHVAWTIPISVGDSYRRHRVVGTTPAMFEHYRYAGGQRLALAAGRWFGDEAEVVIGAQVARRLGHRVGDRIVLAHGGGNVSLHHHDAHPLTVSGVLAPTGTPVDQTLYISLETHADLHRGWESGVPLPQPAHAPDRTAADAPEAISAFLVGLDNRTAAFALQYQINQKYQAEPLLAILPGLALEELWRITALAEQLLRLVALLVVIAGLLGMLTTLLATLNERRREMAILRACGARPWQVAGLLVFEAAMLSAAGIVLGLVVSLATLALLAPWVLVHFGVAVHAALPRPWLLAVLVAIWVAALCVALLPAVMVYRRTLIDGMQVRL
ncbi:MAG: ABC transporter permease [Wenzhouxiangellaceae bacterium]